MVKIKNNTIWCTQGDTVETQITMLVPGDGDPVPYVPSVGDKIRFAIKSDYDDETPIIVKDIPTDTMVLRVEADETKKLPARRLPYVYDIELSTPSGLVDTFIAKQHWYSTEEVY